MMGNDRESIQKLIATDRLADALGALAEFVGTRNAPLANEVTALQGRLSRVGRDERRGILPRDSADRVLTEIRFAALGLLEAAAKINQDSPLSAPTIFISYHHGDRDVATQLADRLRAHAARVIIDLDSMGAGQDIGRFIAASVRESDLTLCVVSNNSLLSPWVAMETLKTFSDEELSDQSKFVACYVESDFLDKGFRLQATKRIDTKLSELNAVIKQHRAAKVDFYEVTEQKQSYLRLRAELGKILQRLRQSHVMDIRAPQQLDSAVDRLIARVTRR